MVPPYSTCSHKVGVWGRDDSRRARGHVAQTSLTLSQQHRHLSREERSPFLGKNVWNILLNEDENNDFS